MLQQIDSKHLAALESELARVTAQRDALQPWTIKQLYAAMMADLNACNSEFERTNVKAICGREIREKAMQWAKERKLTPVEVAIAEKFGFMR